ncbi:MAG: DUF3313 domain-containing protein [Pseudomonas sp.]|uniref:DUF3313 domain-containing protein n=1 Tax=Pseudomonas sp. TaxID=306 RepID=UPI0027343749|nr:DUF3313 domain-containing protein [Pseudomonas sp.]MDP3847404.1 DUF3313 domain-containing protein [Pseudomonas sp.]
MNMTRNVFAGVVFSSLLLAGCVSKVTEQSQYSGFLPSYAGLQEVTTPSGAKVLRWMAPSFTPGAYNTVVFKQLELYPAPAPSDRVDLKTLQELQSYTSLGARNVLAQKFLVVPDLKAAPAGSRSLIMRVAITGVSASNEGMKWYEVVPVAAVIGGVSAATGQRDQNTELYLEADVIDASSGQPVVKVVRKVFGGVLKNASQVITVNDFKVALKGVTDDMNVLLK